MKKLSATEWGLVASLVVYLVADFLLTPLSGLETRPPADVTVVGAISLGVFFVGAILAVAAIVLLFLGRGPVAVLSIVAAVTFLPGFLADQTGNLSKLHAPTAIFWMEWVQALIVVAVIALSIRARAGSMSTR